MSRAGCEPQPVYCAHCAHQIQGCLGKHGSWMHTATRREHCKGDKTLADPEMPGVAVARYRDSRRALRLRRMEHSR